MVIRKTRSDIDLALNGLGLALQFLQLFLGVGKLLDVRLRQFVLVEDLLIQLLDQFLELLRFRFLLLLKSLETVLALADLTLYLFILLFKRFEIPLDILDLIVKLLDLHLILLSIGVNLGQQLVDNRVLPHVHLLLQRLRLSLDLLILVGDRLQVRLHPGRRVNLSFRRNTEQLSLVLVSKLSKISFSMEHFLEIVVLHRFLLDVDLHFPQFTKLLLKLLPQRVLLRVLRLKLLQTLIRFLQCLSDVPVLLLSHANGLILLGERNFV